MSTFGKQTPEPDPEEAWESGTGEIDACDYVLPEDGVVNTLSVRMGADATGLEFRLAIYDLDGAAPRNRLGYTATFSGDVTEDQIIDLAMSEDVALTAGSYALALQSRGNTPFIAAAADGGPVFFSEGEPVLLPPPEFDPDPSTASFTLYLWATYTPGLTVEVPSEFTPPDVTPATFPDADPAAQTASWPRDIALDDEGDLLLEAGDLVLLTGVDAIASDLQSRLLFHRGEWFLDETVGVPYLEQRDGTPAILGNRANLQALRAAFQTEILATPGVRDLSSIDVAYNSATRALAVKFSVTTDYGELALDVPVGV